MKQLVLLAAVGSTLFMACHNAQKRETSDIAASVNNILDIDDIEKVEKVLADSTYEDAAGDTAWHRINRCIVRIKVGSSCYLRKETPGGSVTDVTYTYE